MCRHLGSQLAEMENVIEKMMESDLVEYAMQDIRRRLEMCRDTAQVETESEVCIYRKSGNFRRICISRISLVQTKFVKYNILKYFTQRYCLQQPFMKSKSCKSPFVKHTTLENNHLYGTLTRGYLISKFQKIKWISREDVNLVLHSIKINTRNMFVT